MSKSNYYGLTSQYQSSVNALQRQTAKLLAERQKIVGASSNFQLPRHQPQHYPESTSLTPVVHHDSRKDHRTEEVVSKLQQIIKLCKQEGALSHQQMREVVKVQSQVLNYLRKTTDEAEPQVVRPAYSSEQVIKSKEQKAPPSFQNSSSNVNHTWGKVPTNRQILSEDTVEAINQIERKALSQIIHLQQERDAYRRQKQLMAAEVERMRREFVRLSAGDISQQVPFVDNGELERVRQQNQQLRMYISEVERSTKERITSNATQSAQTNKLRAQNSMLRAQNQYLKQTLEKVNTQKIYNRQTVKVDPRPVQDSRPSSANLMQNQFSSQITVYENELKRASVVINELRSRLANVPGLQELHEQGERIRRETTQLLRLKNQLGGYVHDNQIIQELQQRLENQERGKKMFLEQLKGFKQKYIELEEENKALRKSKVSFDPLARHVDVSSHRESTSPRAGIIKKHRGGFLGDYENTLQEMKHVLY